MLSQKPDSCYSYLKHILKCIYVSIEMASDGFPAPKTLEQKEALRQWLSIHNITMKI